MPPRGFMGERPPMRRATDHWIVVALLGLAIWGWTQTIRLLVMGEAWGWVLPIAVGTVLITVAEVNLALIWIGRKRDRNA